MKRLSIDHLESKVKTLSNILNLRLVLTRSITPEGMKIYKDPKFKIKAAEPIVDDSVTEVYYTKTTKEMREFLAGSLWALNELLAKERKEHEISI